MARSLLHLRLMLWKNFKLKRDEKVATVFEILLPAAFSVILALIRSNEGFKPVDVRNATTYEPFSIAAQNMSSTCTIIPEGAGTDDALNATSMKHLFLYTPNTDDVKRIVEQAVIKMGYTILQYEYKLLGLDNEQEMEDYTSKNMSKGERRCIVAGIVFESGIQRDGKIEGQVTYKIRQTYEDYDTENVFDEGEIGPRAKEHNDGGPPFYAKRGFLQLQAAIDLAVIEMSTRTSLFDLGQVFGRFGKPDSNSLASFPKRIRENVEDLVENSTILNIQMKRFPYPPYTKDNYITVIQLLMPFLIVLSFIIDVPYIVKKVSLEKEKGLKEFMKMLGMSKWVYWSSWFISSLTLMIIPLIIITTVLFVPLSENGACLIYSDFALFFIILLLWIISSIMLCLMVSTFFATATGGSTAIIFVWILTFAPYMFLQEQLATMPILKVLVCLLPNTGIGIALKLIGAWEKTSEGAVWSNVATTLKKDDDFSLLTVMIMFVVDAIIFGIIMAYVEAIKPGDHGIALKWNFCCKPSYWCPRKSIVEIHDPITSQTSEFIEQHPSGLHKGIEIKRLTKRYGKAMTYAVNNLNLNIYEGQISVLLGHNGAGKSTTMGMLTGFITPTSGSAIISGYDIGSHLQKARHNLGLCPQHNILFDALSVKEHMILYARMKGFHNKGLSEEIKKWLNLLDLVNKKNTLARNLSGGMKRKLCLINAMIGNAKVVMLDEPTSGMDPSARRLVWDVLEQERWNRTILLTTHFMDEADHLGDRIAIMAEGEVQCCGSPLFLKSKYGAGYYLNIVKGDNCDIKRIDTFIKTKIAQAKMERNVSRELCYILPKENSKEFPKMFEEMESQQGPLGILSFGISITTMEEVFLKVGKVVDMAKSVIEQNNAPIKTIERMNISYTSNTGVTLYMQQFRAMFNKQLVIFWRNKSVIISRLILPVVFVLLPLLSGFIPSKTSMTPLTLDISVYGKTVVPFAKANNYEFGNILEKFKSYASSKGQTPLDLMAEDANKKLCNVSQCIDTYLLKKEKENLKYFHQNHFAGATFQITIIDLPNKSTNTQSLVPVISFNNQPLHTVAIALSILSNSLLDQYANGKNIELITVNHPLPIAEEDEKGETFLFLALFVVLAMSLVASSFIPFLIQERECKSKHLQFVSGVHIINFWLATFLWDFLNYCVAAAVISVMFTFKIKESFLIVYTLMLLLLYGWSMLPVMFLLSFLFTVPATGSTRVIMINTLIAFATLLIVMQLEASLDDEARRISTGLGWFFTVMAPHYCLGMGIMDMLFNYKQNQSEICERPCTGLTTGWNPCCGICGTSGWDCQSKQNDYLSMDRSGIGRYVMFMAIQGIVYWVLLIFAEYKLFRKAANKIKVCYSNAASSTQNIPMDVDGDVLAEQTMILNSPMGTLNKDNTVIIKELSKYYGQLLAVNNLSLGIRTGECFGLLGVNGAGKTTTFKVLTGDIPPSFGKVYLDGYDLSEDIKKAQQRIGYCPQFDALLDSMTGRETLYMYGRMRGIPENKLKDVVDSFLIELTFDVHADKQVKAYSGGNKRKLSTALALIGNPKIVLLDEPTTGMDPEARRHLWTVLNRAREGGKSVVLTSHSMEECEALCSRLAIMVNGLFKCLGSVQHIKSTFGQGFMITIKIPQEETAMHVKDYLQANLPGCVSKGYQYGLINLQILKSDDNEIMLRWSRLFHTLEEAKKIYNFDDYSITQPTLEQVFISFATMQCETTE